MHIPIKKPTYWSAAQKQGSTCVGFFHPKENITTLYKSSRKLQHRLRLLRGNYPYGYKLENKLRKLKK